MKQKKNNKKKKKVEKKERKGKANSRKSVKAGFAEHYMPFIIFSRWSCSAIKYMYIYEPSQTDSDGASEVSSLLYMYNIPKYTTTTHTHIYDNKGHVL